MALDMFINMGAKIKGESKDKAQGPKGDIDILAWSLCCWKRFRANFWGLIYMLDPIRRAC